MSTSSNGWRSGRDPVQRWLRTITAVVSLATAVYLSIDPDRHLDVVPCVGIFMGVVLVLLGYERLIKLPYIGRDNEDKRS